MSRYDRHDILMELIELCRDLKSEILQQLNYYRASVYKNETAELIEAKIEQLRLVASLIGDDELLDAFQDYQVMKKSGSQLVAPGECLLSFRTMRLLQAVETISAELSNHHPQASREDMAKFSQEIRQARPQLLSLCRQGSRQWAFFNRL